MLPAIDKQNPDQRALIYRPPAFITEIEKNKILLTNHLFAVIDISGPRPRFDSVDRIENSVPQMTVNFAWLCGEFLTTFALDGSLRLYRSGTLVAHHFVYPESASSSAAVCRHFLFFCSQNHAALCRFDLDKTVASLGQGQQIAVVDSISENIDSFAVVPTSKKIVAITAGCRELARLDLHGTLEKKIGMPGHLDQEGVDRISLVAATASTIVCLWSTPQKIESRGEMLTTLALFSKHLVMTHEQTVDTSKPKKLLLLEPRSHHSVVMVLDGQAKVWAFYIRKPKLLQMAKGIEYSPSDSAISDYRMSAATVSQDNKSLFLCGFSVVQDDDESPFKTFVFRLSVKL